ncbi:MAG: PstS family phosphate ABC transporter substrate-binding protein [Lysobacterales bacterium]
MQVLRWIAALLLWSLLIPGWSADLTIRLHGSNTVGSKLGPELLAAYARQRGYVGVQTADAGAEEYRVEGRNARGERFIGIVKAHGTNTGYADLVSAQADLWMASRAAKPEEVEAAKAAIGDLHSAEQEHVIALDGLALIVHPDNPLAQLSIDQIRRAYAGEVQNWSAFGGPNRPIHLYGRDDQSGTYDSFKSMVLGERALAPTTQRFESSRDLEAAVAGDPSALGFVGYSYVRQSKALAVFQGATLPLRPDSLSISTEDYLLARRLYLYSAQNASAEVQDFLRFVLAPAGQAVVSSIGFVAQNVFVAEAEPVAGNPEGYYAVVADAERLSVNFRFRPESSTLDSRGMRDIERLGAFMQRPENQGKALRLAGFAAPGERTPIITLLTVNDRVDIIAQLLAARGVATEISRGFVGGIAVAPSGQARNERVEVWLVDRSSRM